MLRWHMMVSIGMLQMSASAVPSAKHPCLVAPSCRDKAASIVPNLVVWGRMSMPQTRQILPFSLAGLVNPVAVSEQERAVVLQTNAASLCSSRLLETTSSLVSLATQKTLCQTSCPIWTYQMSIFGGPERNRKYLRTTKNGLSMKTIWLN